MTKEIQLPIYCDTVKTINQRIKKILEYEVLIGTVIAIAWMYLVWFQHLVNKIHFTGYEAVLSGCALFIVIFGSITWMVEISVYWEQIMKYVPHLTCIGWTTPYKLNIQLPVMAETLKKWTHNLWIIFGSELIFGMLASILFLYYAAINIINLDCLSLGYGMMMMDTAFGFIVFGSAAMWLLFLKEICSKIYSKLPRITCIPNRP
jgi:hypothetical protein